MTVRDTVWQTRPLQCWDKLKEMRSGHYQQVAAAKSQGKMLVTGSAAAPIPLLDGFGDDVVFFSGEGYGGSVATDVALTTKYAAAAGRQGYSRTTCSYMRSYWGAMFCDHFMFDNGPFPKPDFCFTEHFCDAAHAKWFQVVAEHYGVPMVAMDIPIGPSTGPIGHRVEYVAQQLADCVDQITRITGRQFDDERFIAASRCYFACQSLWAEISLLNRAVPAPLDLKTIFAVMPVVLLARNKPECVAALTELRDEVKDRIAQQIGALPLERIRLVTDQIPPWSFLQMFRLYQNRGVVFVGLWMYTATIGVLDFAPDFTVTRGKTPDELGWPMKTRDDVLRAWGRRLVESAAVGRAGDITEYVPQLIGLHKHWRGDGLLMHYNRGCAPALSFQPEVKRCLEKEGIPVAVYEANCGDGGETDEAQIIKRLGAFVDILEAKIN